MLFTCVPAGAALSAAPAQAPSCTASTAGCQQEGPAAAAAASVCWTASISSRSCHTYHTKQQHSNSTISSTTSSTSSRTWTLQGLTLLHRRTTVVAVAAGVHMGCSQVVSTTSRTCWCGGATAWWTVGQSSGCSGWPQSCVRRRRGAGAVMGDTHGQATSTGEGVGG